MLEPSALRAFVPPDPDLTRLPVDFFPGPTPFHGIILMLAGVLGPIFVGGFLGLMGLVGDMPDNWGWIVLGFACFPLLALPWGWYVIRSRTIVRIGAEEVEFLRFTPFRKTRWNAPLSQYKAVAYRKVLPPSTTKAERILHGVELIHETGAWDVTLVQASDEALARDVQTRLAALTGLSAEEREPVRSR